MDRDEFYGDYQAILQEAEHQVLECARHIRQENRCIEHITSRIKSPQSTATKLERYGVAPTLDQAKERLSDLVGVRLVCRFLSDIYTVSQLLRDCYEVVTIKDYIVNPKPNGYRSYHMILVVPTVGVETVRAEIQLRTISQDAWACLEHQIKYKKSIHDEKIVRNELKRCADDLASTDLCMQTIREFIEMDEASIGLKNG